jgi:hypothetical protein
MTNEDAQYLETIQATDAQIANLFRVPGVLVGVNDKTSTYASAEQFFLSFAQHTMLPWVVRIEQGMEKDLILARQAYYIKFNLKGLLRGDTASRFASYNIGRMIGMYSANELRALEEMNPRTDPGGDSFLEPLNMQRSDQPLPKQPSGLLSTQGKPLEESLREEWQWRMGEEADDTGIDIDLNEYGKGLYTNGHARHEEHP